jgi:ribosomal protein S18 acetylase RimI-like enzyme
MQRWRDAQEADIDALVALIESAYRGDASRVGWTTEADLLGGQRIDGGMIADSLADPNQHMLICEEAETGLIGCVTVERRPDYGYIGTVSVRPQLQGGGLGRALLDRAENWLKAQWALTRARMTVIAQRPELIAWYERRGYAPTGETAPFPYGNARFGAPKRDDLYFIVLEKALAA